MFLSISAIRKKNSCKIRVSPFTQVLIGLFLDLELNFRILTIKRDHWVCCICAHKMAAIYCFLDHHINEVGHFATFLHLNHSLSINWINGMLGLSFCHWRWWIWSLCWLEPSTCFTAWMLMTHGWLSIWFTRQVMVVLRLHSAKPANRLLRWQYRRSYADSSHLQWLSRSSHLLTNVPVSYTLSVPLKKLVSWAQVEWEMNLLSCMTSWWVNRSAWRS